MRGLLALQAVRRLWTSSYLFLSSDIPKSETSTSALNESCSDNFKKTQVEEEYEVVVKNKILNASLQFVASHGWTKHALSAGAESIGYPGVIHGMFPREGAELVQYFCVSCNQKLLEKLKAEAEGTVTSPSDKAVPVVFIQNAVETRLRMIVPYLNKWPQALGIMALPPNAPTALANLLIMVDDICYYAGDRSVDFSWYTRRIAIASIYQMTELSLIQDKSEDFRDTWAFLGRRLEDVTHLHRYLQESGEASQVAKETVTSAFITARNILGLNFGNR